jgi:hypothetical protein
MAAKNRKPCEKVTREEVLGVVQRIQLPLTTDLLARVLQTKEVSVRAAIIWLEIGGFIKEQGCIVRRYPGKPYSKRVARWSWTGKADPICKLSIKGTDQADREQNSKHYGDGGLMLQQLMFGKARQ